jgi:hypothetical protein
VIRIKPLYRKGAEAQTYRKEINPQTGTGIQYALDSINAAILDIGPGLLHAGAGCAGVTKRFSTDR